MCDQTRGWRPTRLPAERRANCGPNEPKTSLHRTPSASPPSPLHRKPANAAARRTDPDNVPFDAGRRVISSAHCGRRLQFSRGDTRLRKQYYFRESERGLLAWDVDRLVELSRILPRKRIRLEDIRELDQPCRSDSARLTWREVLGHIKLINEADLSFAIVLSASGDVMDGTHRVVKAALEGGDVIDAVQFENDPAPDYVGRRPDDLPY